MSPDIPIEEKNTGIRNLLTGSGTSPVRIILWLGAIAIVSFAIGFGILAASGVFSSGAEFPNSPFTHTALISPTTMAFPLDNATSGNISVTLGAGELTIGGRAAENNLMEATVFSKAPEWQPDIFSASGDLTKTVRMTDKGHTGKAWFAVDSPNRWEIRLTEKVPVTLNANLGAGDCRLNLGTISLYNLNLHTGAGDTEIDLSRYHGRRFDATITSGIGDLTLKVPATSNTRITVHQGVGDITGSGFTLNNGAYVTAAYNPDLPVNDITIKMGVGTFSLHME